MNERHLALCGSTEWFDAVREWIVPWAVAGVDLGEDLLEIGPGPGATTNVLRTLVRRLTAVEIDGGAAQQNAVFAEALRLLRPGGVLAGSDSLDGPEFRELHEWDVCVPVDPATLAARLAAVGFVGVQVKTNEYAVRFRATKPE